MPCLPAGVSNEAQFVFTIQSIVMAQKLKGTLSFIAKVCTLRIPEHPRRGSACLESPPYSFSPFRMMKEPPMRSWTSGCISAVAHT